MYSIAVRNIIQCHDIVCTSVTNIKIIIGAYSLSAGVNSVKGVHLVDYTQRDVMLKLLSLNVCTLHQ